jgi:hypothetical protein
MAHDYTQCPEFLGPATAVTFGSTGLRWPEETGPFSEVPGDDYGSPGRPRIGAIPPLLDPATRDRERAECERRNLLRQQVQAAALSAAKNAMVAQTLSAQLFADVDAAVEKAVAQDPPGTPAGPEKPRRPHRRTKTEPDAEPAAETAEPETAETPEDAA